MVPPFVRKLSTFIILHFILKYDYLLFHSLDKVPTNNHRQDRYEINAERKPIQTGSRAFVVSLSSRTFSAQSHVLRMDGKHFTEAFIKEKGKR